MEGETTGPGWIHDGVSGLTGARMSLKWPNFSTFIVHFLASGRESYTAKPLINNNLRLVIRVHSGVLESFIANEAFVIRAPRGASAPQLLPNTALFLRNAWER